MCEKRHYMCEKRHYMCEKRHYMCEKRHYMWKKRHYMCEKRHYMCEKRHYMCEKRHTMYVTRDLRHCNWYNIYMSIHIHMCVYSIYKCIKRVQCAASYGVATISRLLKIVGLFLVQGSFAKEAYNFKEPINHSRPISTCSCCAQMSNETLYVWKETLYMRKKSYHGSNHPPKIGVDQPHQKRHYCSSQRMWKETLYMWKKAQCDPTTQILSRCKVGCEKRLNIIE